MSLIFIINNIFQGNAQLVIERVEKVLLVHKGDAADLFNHGLGGRVIVDKVGRYGNG